ncbi:MAG: hypothetical protein ABW110_12330 [Steroidobacteraceae bacterium]
MAGRIGAWVLSVLADARRDRDGRDAGLRHANEQFHAAYDQLRNVHARSGPVLVLIGDELVLWVDDRRSEFAVSSAESRILKEVAHVPVGMFAALHGSLPHGPGQLPTALQRRLAEFQVRPEPQTELGPLSGEARADAIAVLDRVSRLLAEVTTTQRCTGRELAEFAGDVGP